MNRAPLPPSPGAERPPCDPARGFALRILREQRGLSQQEVAQCVGITTASLSRYEHGAHPGARLDRLLQALDLPEWAWVEVVSFVLWLDGVHQSATRPGSLGGGSRSTHEEIERIAHHAGLDHQRSVARRLTFLERLSTLARERGGAGR